MPVDVATKTAAEAFVDVVEEIDLVGQLALRPDLVGKLIDELLEVGFDAIREAR